MKCRRGAVCARGKAHAVVVKKIEGPAGGSRGGGEIAFDAGIGRFEVGRTEERLAGEIAKDEIEGVAVVVGEEAGAEERIDAELGG